MKIFSRLPARAVVAGPAAASRASRSIIVGLIQLRPTTFGVRHPERAAKVTDTPEDGFRQCAGTAGRERLAGTGAGIRAR